MKPELAALVDHLAVIGRELSPDRVDRIANRLEELTTRDNASRLSAANPRERVLLRRLADLWRVVEVDPRAVAMALRASARTAEEVASHQVVELVWTGPQTEEVPVRRNDQALREVIESAETDLLLVSYAVFNVPKIAGALAASVSRGVAVRLVLEFEGSIEGDQTYDPLAALGVLPLAVSIFHWPFENRPPIKGTDKRGYLHVKCAVADTSLAFVSSANLTTYAMEANMELGVLIRGGPVPRRIAGHFDRLISSGMLEPRSRV